MLDATAAAEDQHFWFKGLRRQARLLLAHGLAGRSPRLIVDCGSGTGRNLDWLSEFGPAVGVELSPAGLGHGHRRQRRLVRGTVAALPIADGAADVATSFDVLYCLDDATERQAVREMWRILRPGGVALANLAALDVLHGSHSALTHEQRRYTKPMIRALFGEAGFHVERVTFTNMSPFPVALAKRAVERVTGRAGTASDGDLRVPPAPVNVAMDGLLRLEAAWLRVANLPIGSSLLALVRKPD